MPGGPPVDEDQSSKLLGDEPSAPAHRDESTLLLPSPADSVEDPGNASDTPVEGQQRDTSRLLPGESLATWQLDGSESYDVVGLEALNSGSRFVQVTEHLIPDDLIVPGQSFLELEGKVL